MSEHPLRIWRDAQDLTQPEAAKLIGGVSAMTVSRWERGRVPQKRYWPKIAAVTGIPAVDLLTFEPDGERP